MPFDSAPSPAAPRAPHAPRDQGLAGQLAQVRAGAASLRSDAAAYRAQLDKLMGSDFVALMRRIAASAGR
jgi:hypothetical protein